MATLCLEDLHTKLQNYCNWNSLPTELLSDIKGGTTKASHDADATLAAFITHLTALLPFEWSVTQHATFTIGNSSERSSRLQATMHPAAVGTADGIIVFGGLQLGRLAEVKVENEASWIKESMPAGLAPDCSRVYQVRTGHNPHVELAGKPSFADLTVYWTRQATSKAWPLHHLMIDLHCHVPVHDVHGLLALKQLSSRTGVGSDQCPCCL